MLRYPQVAVSYALGGRKLESICSKTSVLRASPQGSHNPLRIALSKHCSFVLQLGFLNPLCDLSELPEGGDHILFIISVSPAAEINQSKSPLRPKGGNRVQLDSPTSGTRCKVRTLQRELSPSEKSRGDLKMSEGNLSLRALKQLQQTPALGEYGLPW